MISREEAVQVAESMLRELNTSDGVDRVVLGEPTDVAGHWVIGYNSRAYVEDGDIISALAGNGPIAVPRSGEPAFFLTSTRPAAEQLGGGSGE